MVVNTNTRYLGEQSLQKSYLYSLSPSASPSLSSISQSDIEKLSEIENVIYSSLTENEGDESESKEGELESAYKLLIYQFCGDILSGSSLDTVRELVKAGKTGWNHPTFDDIRFKREEQDNFIENPFEVEEGVLECGKCGSMRVFSFTKQTRSADEPMTTFAECIACGKKWTYSG